MENSRKLFINSTLLFAFIGFVTYGFIVFVSFLGCCAGLTSLIFSKLISGIIIIAVSLFIFCVYNNCIKIPKANNPF